MAPVSCVGSIRPKNHGEYQWSWARCHFAELRATGVATWMMSCKVGTVDMAI